jgi:hypothetical protein
VTKIGELGTTQAATSNRRTLRRNTKSPIFVTLMKEASGSSETSVLTRATRRNNPEDTILLFCSCSTNEELYKADKNKRKVCDFLKYGSKTVGSQNEVRLKNLFPLLQRGDETDNFMTAAVLRPDPECPSNRYVMQI